MRGRAVSGCRLVAALLFALFLPTMADAATDPAKVVHDVSDRLGLQTELVAAEPEVPEQSEDWNRERPHFWLTADSAQLVLYAALIIGIGLVLYTLRDQIPAFGVRGLKARQPDAVAEAAAVERMAETQVEADDLARQGRFDEAMHALLLRSMTEMRRRLAVNFADSLTSREVLRALDLTEAGKLSLSDIIRRVEFVYFGRYAAAAADYIACRASYEALTAAMHPMTAS